MAKNGWLPQIIFFSTIWLFLMVAGRNNGFRDPGSLWHIVVGERILTQGQLIDTDPFSFTCEGEPWIAQQWFGEVLLALLHRLGGLDAILLLSTTLLAGLYTWVAHRLLRAGLHPLLVAVVVAWTIAGTSFHCHPRPQLITIVLVGWTFARVCDFEAGRTSLRRLFWLVPVFIVWTNTHGGTFGGVGILVVSTAGWTLAWMLGRESPLTNGRQLLALILLIVLCALTALVNPYGLALPRIWFSLIDSQLLPQVMQEHAPLRYSGMTALVILLIGFFYLVVLAGASPRVWRVSWFIPLLFLYLAWTRVRHGPLFTITAALALGDLLPRCRWAVWLADRGSVLFRVRPSDVAPRNPRAGLRFGAAVLILVACSLVLQRSDVPVPVVGHGWAQLDPTTSPVDLLPDLRRLEAGAPEGTPIFNEMGYAGFLLYHTPGFRLFIDDRCELYGDERLLEYVEALYRDPKPMGRWVQQYDFRIALTGNDSLFEQYFRRSDQWDVVRRGETATLFRRARKKNQQE